MNFKIQMHQSMIVFVLLITLISPSFIVANVSSEYEVAVDYFNKGDIQTAIEIWERMQEKRSQELTPVQKAALRQRLDNAKKLLSQRATPVQMSHSEKAMRSFELACRLNKSEENATAAADQFEKTLILLDEAANQGTSTLNFAYYQAYCLVKLNRIDEVPTLLETAIENQPDSPEPQNLLADYLEKVDNIPAQITAFKKSLKIQPDQLAIRYRLVEALISTKTRTNMREAANIAVRTVDKSEERARELAKLFPKSPYRETLERMATEIAIEKERQKLREEAEAHGKTYRGPSLKVSPGTSGSQSSGNGQNPPAKQGTPSPAGGTPSPAPAPN